MESTLSIAPAIERALDLSSPVGGRRAQVEDGYLDLLGDEDPTGAHPGQQLMDSRALPLIYERWWRPLGGRLLMGHGPDHGRRAPALPWRRSRYLRASGSWTSAAAPATSRAPSRAPPGTGWWSASTPRRPCSLARSRSGGANVAYLRGDAADLPFRDRTFDAVCCFATLYLVAEPMRALDEIARVLAPGGKVAVLSSCNRGPLPTTLTNAIVRSVSGVRVFGRNELTLRAARARACGPAAARGRLGAVRRRAQALAVIGAWSD